MELVCDKHITSAKFEIATKVCNKCSETYCDCNASKTDVRYCKNCMADFRVEESIITKETLVLNGKNEIISRRVQHAMQYTLEGTDWLFSARKILEMNDQDLENTIEYHRAVASIMLTEREHRRMEKSHQLAQIRVVIPHRETQFEKEEKVRKATEKAEAKVTGTGNTKRTTSSKKSTNSKEDLLALVMKLKKAGLTPEMIANLAGAK